MAKKKAPSARKRGTTTGSAPVDPLAAAAEAYAHLDLGGSPEQGRARLAQLQDVLGRRSGSRTVALTLDKAPVARVRKLPFGILMLDWKLRGGAVIGRLNRLWGPKSTLKSTLCLRLVRSAQNHCRHCKAPLVRHPRCTCTQVNTYRVLTKRVERIASGAEGPLVQGTALFREYHGCLGHITQFEEKWGDRLVACEVASSSTNCMDCECPKPRWWVASDDDYGWLPAEAGVALYYGQLPDGIEWKKVKDHGTDAAPLVPVLACDPPTYATRNADGSEKAKQPKRRDIVFRPMVRCEPMRVVYVDGEGTIDLAWVVANGVDPSLVVSIGNRFGEEALETVEESVLTRDFDLIVIDSTSVLMPKAEIEKGMSDRPKVAASAAMLGRWVTRHIAAMFDDGLTARYRPTILTTSQVTTHGLSGGMRAYSAPTDGNRFEHGLSLDIRMREAGYTFDKAQEHAISGKFEFEVKKNKAGGSVGAKGEIRFWLVAQQDHPVGDSDDLATVMTKARELGEGYIVEGTKGKGPALTLCSRYVDDGQMAFARVGDCEGFLRDNPTIYDDLRGRVLTRLMEDPLATLQVVGQSAQVVGAAIVDDIPLE